MGAHIPYADLIVARAVVKIILGALALQIYEEYRSAAATILRNNPRILAWQIHGVANDLGDFGGSIIITYRAPLTLILILNSAPDRPLPWTNLHRPRISHPLPSRLRNELLKAFSVFEVILAATDVTRTLRFADGASLDAFLAGTRGLPTSVFQEVSAITLGTHFSRRTRIASLDTFGTFIAFAILFSLLQIKRAATCRRPLFIALLGPLVEQLRAVAALHLVVVKD